MIATNHALAGAAIGLAVGNPIIALPAALLSHFVLDALPHFGPSGSATEFIKKRRFTVMLLADAALCAALVAGLFIVRPEHWQLAAACAFVATSPDLLSINEWLHARAGKPWRPGLIKRFAAWVQWFERPPGAVVEVAWFVSASFVVATLAGLVK